MVQAHHGLSPVMPSAWYIQMEKVRLSSKSPSVVSLLQNILGSLILGTMSVVFLLPGDRCSPPGGRAGGGSLAFNTSLRKKLQTF